MGPYELLASIPSFASIAVPDWAAGLLVVAFVVYLLFVWTATNEIVTATAALKALQNKEDPDKRIAALEKLAAESDKWMKLTERSSGVKAALFGVIGVLLGVIGGLAGSWVAAGVWTLDNTGRALIVVAVVGAISAIGFWRIYRWKPSETREKRTEKTATL